MLTSSSNWDTPIKLLLKVLNYIKVRLQALILESVPRTNRQYLLTFCVGL